MFIAPMQAARRRAFIVSVLFMSLGATVALSLDAASASPKPAQPTAASCFDVLSRPDGYVGSPEALRHLMRCAQPYPGLAERLIVQAARQRKAVDTQRQQPAELGLFGGIASPGLVKNLGAFQALGSSVAQMPNGRFTVVPAAAVKAAPPVKPPAPPVASHDQTLAVLSVPAVVDELNQEHTTNLSAVRTANFANTAATAAKNAQVAQATTCNYRKNTLSATSGLLAVARSVFLRDVAAIAGLVAPIPFSSCEQAADSFKPVINISTQHPFVGETDVTVSVTERNYGGSFHLSSDDSTVLTVPADPITSKSTAAVTPVGQGSASIIATDDNGNQSFVTVLVDVAKPSKFAVQLSDQRPFKGETNVTATLSELNHTGTFALRSDNEAVLTVTPVPGKTDTWAVTLV